MKLSNNESNVCPCCGRHCSVNELSCRRGMEHFGVEPETNMEMKHHHEQNRADMTIDDKVISLMRRCGHHLHHNVNDNVGGEQLLSALSHDEKKELISLLKKCLKSWQ